MIWLLFGAHVLGIALAGLAGRPGITRGLTVAAVAPGIAAVWADSVGTLFIFWAFTSIPSFLLAGQMIFASEAGTTVISEFTPVQGSAASLAAGMVLGSFVAVLAGVGLLRFETNYARFRAAGKASPVAFLVITLGGAWHLDWASNLYLAIAAVAMALTLPIRVRLLVRAVHRTTPGDHVAVGDLTSSELSA